VLLVDEDDEDVDDVTFAMTSAARGWSSAGIALRSPRFIAATAAAICSSVTPAAVRLSEYCASTSSMRSSFRFIELWLIAICLPFASIV